MAKKKVKRKTVKKKKTSRRITAKPTRKPTGRKKKAPPKKSASRKPSPKKKKTVKKKKKTLVRKKPLKGKKKTGKKTVKKTPKKALAGKKPRLAKQKGASPSPPDPGSGEKRIGSIIHYFNHLGVAVVRLDRGILRLGDNIRITGHTTDLEQRVDSMEVDRQAITQASAGQEFGMKVRDAVRDHDGVWITKP